MKVTGVWIDKKQAQVVNWDGEKSNSLSLDSEVEFFNPKGGSRSKTKWGPQEVVQDSRYLEREKHQLRLYFENLHQALGGSEAIVLYGPAGTNRKFKKWLDETDPSMAAKVKLVMPADKMSLNQLKAKVRDYFSESPAAGT
jgi:hypothetical protein